MPRRTFAQEAIRMDHLRTSSSQQHLAPTSRSSTSSQPDQDDLDQDMQSSNVLVGAGTSCAELSGGPRPHKLDLYSIPVFLLECFILGALGYGAYFMHFQMKPQPSNSGFYCDDISLRQVFKASKFTEQFGRPDDELTLLILFMVLPLAAIVFCELVNSMFGSLKFRQIRSLCKCCKLHSITRRTLRFSSAYLLGFFIVMISCDILATSTGKLRPSFAQECPLIYMNECKRSMAPVASQSSKARDLSSDQLGLTTSAPALSLGTTMALESTASGGQLTDAAQPPGGDLLNNTMDSVRPASQPISSQNSSSAVNVFGGQPQVSALVRTRRDTSSSSSSPFAAATERIIEREWVDLTDADLKSLCQFQGDAIQERNFYSLARSWPSFPGAIFAYACLYLAFYISFVGTARPFRLITCVLVMFLLLAATIFNIQLIKEHYNHWEDCAGAAGLSFIVVIFILLVYLNKFRDTHYYENQKLYGSASKRQQQLRRSIMMMSDVSPHKLGNNNGVGQYHLDKIDSSHTVGVASAPIVQNGTEPAGGPSSNNDLAMRYFQIPRANYRGAPRPLSSMNRN